VPLDPGGSVTDGNLGVVRSDSPGSAAVIVADGMAPGTEVEVSVRLPQLMAVVALDPDSFGPDSAFDPNVFVAGEQSSVPPVLGQPTPVSTLTDTEIGAWVVNAIKFNPEDLGLSPTDFVNTLGGDSTFRPFPDLDINDPIIQNALNWILMDVVSIGGVPGSIVEVIWYSNPVRLGLGVLNESGNVAFQVAIPDTLISAGETDSLRIFSQYRLARVATDSTGNFSYEATLPPELLALAEPGALLNLIASGLDENGQTRIVSVELSTDGFAAGEDSTRSRWWWLLLLLIPAGLAAYFLAKRRGQNDESEPSTSDNQPEPSTGL
jgi:hypothetical protein